MDDLRPRQTARDNKKGGKAEARRPKGDAMAFREPERPTGGKSGDESNLFSAAHVAERRRQEAWLADRVAKGTRGVFSETIKLSPVLAELLLESNEENRALRRRSLEAYKTDIQNGSWALNGESIKVSVDGLLNDGQHRCTAVVEAGRTIQTIVTFGVDRNSRFTVDQGAVRTAGNYLGMHGVKDANVAAAVAGLIWQYENNTTIGDGGTQLPTKAQVSQTYDKHASAIDASVSAIPGSGRIANSKSVLAFCHFLIARRASVQATAFILRLCLGDGLSRTDPIYRCRERLLNDGRKLRQQHKIELIIRAWNASRSGKQFKKSCQITGAIPAVEK